MTTRESPLRSAIFRRSNLRMMIGLAVLFLLLLANGALALITWNTSNSRIGYYHASESESRETLALFQKQVHNWKEMLLSERGGRVYRTNFYAFSQQSSRIQDALFNLRMKFLDQKEIAEEFLSVSAAHHALTGRYLSLLFELERGDKKDGIDPSDLVREEEGKALNAMHAVVAKMAALAEKEIARTNILFIISIAVSLTVISALFVLFIILIARNTLRAQKRILAIGMTLNSYLPPQLVDSILAGDDLPIGKPSRKFVTVCFTDLQGFTEMNERIEPDNAAEILNEYLSDMTLIAHAWGGMVDKFMGDGIMILFGVFNDSDPTEDAEKAIMMACAMQEHMERLGEKWRFSIGERSLRLRIGIHSGEANVGAFGPRDRRTFTAIGTAVNIASRLEKQCPPGRVLVSDTTKGLIHERVLLASMGERQIKGIEKAIATWSPETLSN